jgi:hypothetical protein
VRVRQGPLQASVPRGGARKRCVPHPVPSLEPSSQPRPNHPTADAMELRCTLTPVLLDTISLRLHHGRLLLTSFRCVC